jgi:hypothetical protein
VAAFGALLRAGRERQEQGTFAFAADAMPGADIAAIMRVRA